LAGYGREKFGSKFIRYLLIEREKRYFYIYIYIYIKKERKKEEEKEKVHGFSLGTQMVKLGQKPWSWKNQTEL